MKSTRYLMATFVLLLFDLVDLNGQALRNFDFEKPGIINKERPLDWNVVAIGYEVFSDSNNTQKGNFSLKSKNTQNYETGLSRSTMQLPVQKLRGNQLNLSVWIRTDSIEDGFAAARLDLTDSDGGHFIHFPEEGVTGTTEWNRYDTELEIDKGTEALYLNMFHSGTGTAWFDHVEVQIDGEDYKPEMYEPWMATTDEITWLEDNVMPLQTDAPNSGFDDLNQMKEMFENANMIGLGEATHGTREFFRMKHRFVEWFSSQSDTTIFVIEASMPEARIVNDYVLYGKGDPKEALAGMNFWVWNSQEVLDMIEWMRDYNESGQGVVEFWGNDLQFPHLAADSVEVFVEKVDPGFLDELQGHYSRVRQAEREELRTMSQDQLSEICHEVLKVRSHLESNQDNYLSMVDTMSMEWAIQNARIVEQGVAMYIFDEDSRDRSMALNTEWIYNHHTGKESNMVIWAHNAHIRYSDGLGNYLAETYGDQYTSVGFAFGEGEYSAVTGEDAVRSYPTPPLRKGSVEYALSSTEIPAFALDLRHASEHEYGKWLADQKLFKDIGSIAFEDPYYLARIANQYDILIYFDQTNPSESFGRP